MKETGKPTATDDPVVQLLADVSPEVRDLALKARVVIRKLIPDAAEEVEPKQRLFGYTFTPRKYKGLILTVGSYKNHVSIIFAKGVELMQFDPDGLLEGTGKLARHIKIRSTDQFDDRRVQALIRKAVELTRRDLEGR